jgi:phosphoserine phosphatase RsbU/P
VSACLAIDYNVHKQSSQSRAQRVLVADDQTDVREALRLLLKGAGFHASTASSPAELLEIASAQSFNLILMDMNYSRDTTSGEEGLRLLEQLHARHRDTPIIVMTAWGDVELAVEAMRRGAADFVQKPWDNKRLLFSITNRLEQERRTHSELDIARRVQQKLLPQGSKHLRTVMFAGRCVPASEIGGDYFDFFDLGPEHAGFVLADVSGKGMAAAMLMANLQALFRSQASLASVCPEQILESVNGLFYASTNPEHYTTLFFGHYDDQTRRLAYINCGHPPPLLVRADGAVERLNATATVLGLFPKWKGSAGEIAIAPGDTLLAYSDGITEAGIGAGDDFGEERLLSVAVATRHLPLEAIIDNAMRAAQTFEQGEQSDDCTLLGLRAVE